jgi:hypothetical protein
MTTKLASAAAKFIGLNNYAPPSFAMPGTAVPGHQISVIGMDQPQSAEKTGESATVADSAKHRTIASISAAHRRNFNKA